MQCVGEKSWLSLKRVTNASWTDVYLRRRAMTKWLNMAAIDTQDVEIGCGGFLYVCVEFLDAIGLTG